MTESPTLDFDLLIETSWEVCNKVGGIYTVLSTKARTLQKYYKDKVIFIGPDVWTEEHPSPDFIESKSLLKKWRDQLMLTQGVTVRVGRWDVPGKPIAILVGFQSMFAYNNRLYARMWELYGVDSLHAYGDYGEATAFSHAAALVIEDLAKFHGIESGKRMISHFDEWTTGMGLLYIKDVLPEMATIFTTHATCIGRSICGNGKPLYDNLEAYNGDQMARELNMEAKHSLEKAAAHQADCFTTVSDVTSRECEQLLERKPDVVTPNGFEFNYVPSTKAKLAEARETSRQRLFQIANILTGNNYSDDTFIVITSGRCEYHNKGLDLFLDSIAKLGDIDPSRKILAYIMVPAWEKCPRQDLSNSLRLNNPHRHDNPVITHELNNPWEDSILNRIHSIGFTNDTNSRVSVIYVPCYLNGTDGIFEMSYYELLPGADATVFASYYEPWGYTPLESISFGVPTITTTLSGFGQWVLSTCENSFEACGVKVEKRGDYDYDQVKNSIALDLKQLVGATPKQGQEISKAARNTANTASWEYFIKFYNKAFEIALNNEAARFQI